MRRLPIAALPIPLLFLTGCGDDPLTVETGMHVQLQVERMFLSGPADSMEVTMSARTASGEPTAVPSSVRLAVVEESRGFQAFPVLSADALERGMVRPTAPGRVEIAAVGVGITTDTLTITVESTEPVIGGLRNRTPVGVGDTLRLWGEGLDRMDPASVFLAGARLEAVDALDSLATFALADVPDGGCAREAPRRLAVPGTWVLPDRLVPEITLNRVLPTLEPSLLPGEHLTFEADACLLLPGVDGPGDYILTYTDPRPIRAAASEPERDDTNRQVDFSFRLIDESAVPGTNLLVRASAPARSAPAEEPAVTWWNAPALPGGNADPDYFLNRRSPWRAGDRFSYEHPLLSGDEMRGGSILGIVNGYLALGVLDEHEQGVAAGVMDHFQTEVADLLTTAVPFLEASYSDRRPTTTSGSGQVLVLLDPGDDGGVSGGTFAGSAWIVLEVGTVSDPSPLPLLAGLVRLWQDAYVGDRLAEGSYRFSDQLWGSRGAVSFATEEILRLSRRVPFDADLPMAEVLGPYATELTSYVRTLTPEGPINNFHFAEGGPSSAWFSRYLVGASMRRGWSYETAVREVLRGAFDGWYGVVRSSGGSVVRQPYSLHARLAPILGEDWDPARTLAVAAAALFADDLTDSVELQIPTYARAWDPALGPLAAFGRGENGWVEAVLNAYSYGFFTLDGYSNGGALAVSSDGASQWVLVRLR